MSRTDSGVLQGLQRIYQGRLCECRRCLQSTTKVSPPPPLGLIFSSMKIGLTRRSATIDRLYLLWIALTTMLWFQALFALSAAFIHFYLFYILTIPFDHLVQLSPSSDESEQEDKEEDQVQKEVDIRARCERAPFEEYIWVWWAWWALRRSPVAHIYATLVGGMALASVSAVGI